jgi:hypothetical protein
MELTELTLSTWEDFEVEIQSLFAGLKKKSDGLEVSAPLFRGHVNATWKLKTTLERYSGHQYSMLEYYSVMRSVKSKVESVTEKTWDLIDEYDIDEGHRRGLAPQGYPFMIYLRHHGFPSPLLDWTRSPYVAAFFAFRTGGMAEDDKIAIYSYVEHSGYAHITDHDKAALFVLGPNVTTHRRHHAQQSEYTVCYKLGQNGYVYCDHEEALGGHFLVQGIPRKYIIPRKEKGKALERLHTMNINAYSLFGDEETLMETLAYEGIAKGNF